MTRPRATTSPSDALGATIADLKARLARLENIAHQHRVLGSHLGLQEVLYFDTVGTDSFVKSDYPWLRAVRVRVQGGGGGGGRTDGVINTGAAGGGGGVYAESFISDLSTITDPITVAVGGGGAGGTSVGAGTGGTGGASSFGSLVVASGGLGGGRGFGTGRSGGPNDIATSGAGDVVIAGGSGHPCFFQNTDVTTGPFGGAGGASRLGNGSRYTLPNNNGAVGVGAGSGGGGASNGGSAVLRNGGAGAQGIVIVELYA